MLPAATYAVRFDTQTTKLLSELFFRLYDYSFWNR
jgi:hypothetical protein